MHTCSAYSWMEEDKSKIVYVNVLRKLAQSTSRKALNIKIRINYFPLRDKAKGLKIFWINVKTCFSVGCAAPLRPTLRISLALVTHPAAHAT